MSDRFPSISPDGLRIAASALPRGGQPVQYVGPAVGEWQPVPVEFDASGGVWETPRRLLFVRNKTGDPQDGAILLWDGFGVTLYQAAGLEGWSCHNGRFAGWLRTDRLKSITTSRDGHIAGTIDLGDGLNVILTVDGVEIDRGPISEPRYTGEALVWVKWVDGVRRIFGRKHHAAPTENLSWPLVDDEFWPLAIETPLGLYVLTHGHPEKGRPLWMRPWGEGQTHGHIVATGITDRPDARALERGLVLVAYSNLVALQRVHVNLAAVLVDLRGSSGLTTPVLDTSSVVDIVDYLPIGVTLDGDHLYAMKVLGVVNRPQDEAGPLTVYALAKHTDGGGEWWAFDDEWLYQLMDQAGSPIEDVISGVFAPRFAPNGDRIDANYLSPDARVMPRRIRTGMPALRVVTNLFHIANPGQQPTAWRYVNSFEVYSSWPTPHGPLPAIRLKTNPRTTRDPNGRLKGGYEYGTYCRSDDRTRWYVTWEQWRTKDDNSGDEIMSDPADGKPLFRAFSRVVDIPITWRPSRRPANAPFLPAAQKVGMTIAEPTTYPATATGNRFRAVCGPNPGEGWSSWVEWIYRRVGESAWTQQGERRNPRDDNDHTFTFAGNGDYEIGLRWSSGQTGKQRIVQVRAVPQPTPEPQPEPEPSPSQTMQIQTNDRQHFITVSGNGTATATQTSADHATVQLTLVRGKDGRFALRAPNGLVGSAQPDGTFTFDRQKDADWQPDGWEALRAERSPLGGETYVTDHGTRLRAIDQGGSELRHDPRDVADIDETFWPSVSLVGGGVSGGGPVGPSIISGRLRKEGRALADDAGYSLPVFCHSGTGIADLLYDEPTERHNATLIKSVGYAGRRVWTRLRGTAPWSTNPKGWGGREFGHETMGDDAYRNLLITSFRQHQELGLKLALSAGDIEGIDNEHEIRKYVRLLGDALEAVSPDGSLCAIFESGNELPGIWRNGSPERARDWILKPFKARFPSVLCTNSQGANESREERFRWCLDPADLDDIHSFRDNHWYDWIRHVINNAYVHEHGTQPREIIWGSEMFGTGRLVSVQPNIHEYDEHVAQIAIVAHLMTGQIPCYFCSPGIRFDVARDLYGESYESMPGFSTAASVATLLPADIMTWPRENIVHGGREDPPGSPNPIFEEPGSGEIDRAYHVFSADHRRFAALIFGGESLDSRAYRAHHAEVDHRFGNKARLVVGRV